MRIPALLTILILLASSSITFAQDLDSTTYKLIAPSVGESLNGIASSNSYTALIDSSPVDDFTTSSANYTSQGGTAAFTEANVPQISCFETSTSSGTCSIGSNGMQEVCGISGCYDRAKFKIDSQNNATDTRYAIQISTDSGFATNVFHVDGVSRLIKSSLSITDFLYQCEWEGTASAGYCGSPNTTYQKYNVYGLSPGTTYYIRAAALHGDSADGTFTQSDWGPSATAATVNTTLSIDIDIATTVGGSSSPPYTLNLGTLTAGSITTGTNYIIVRHGTNALSGTKILIKGTNGGLYNGTSTIANVNADLASNFGYGLRNESTTNSQNYNTYIGAITVSTTPSDFSDTGAADRVGSPTTSFITLFTSNSLPLHTGVSAYEVKVKPDFSATAGSYSETLTYMPLPSF